MTWPTIIDLGTSDDAGEWLKARPYVHFPWLEFGDDAAREQADPLASEPSISFHANEVRQ